MKNSQHIEHAASDGAAALGQSSRRALALSALFALIGAVLLTLYLHRFEEEVSGGGRISLVTVRTPVERGAMLTADMLSSTAVPRAYAEQRAVRQSERAKVVGVRAANALKPQDTLLWSDLALAGEDRDLSSLVQPGKRAVTVRASESGSDPAGHGLVRPGDYVDVIISLRPDFGATAQSAAVVLLQRVLVLAVGSRTEPHRYGDDHEQSGRELERELTLSLRLEEVQLLSLARERGALSVALRAPSDAKVIENIADVPVAALYDRLARETVQRRAPAAVSSSVPTRIASDR